MGNHLIGHPTNLISAIFGDQPCSVSFSFIVGNKCAGKRGWCERQRSALGRRWIRCFGVTAPMWSGTINFAFCLFGRWRSRSDSAINVTALFLRSIISSITPPLLAMAFKWQTLERRQKWRRRSRCLQGKLSGRTVLEWIFVFNVVNNCLLFSYRYVIRHKNMWNVYVTY